MKYLLFLLIFICSCTVNWKEEQQDPEHIDDIWFSEEVVDGCHDLFIIKDRYVSGRVCHLFDDSFGAEVEAGNYVAYKNSVDFFPEFSSCSKPVFNSQHQIDISDLTLDDHKYNDAGNVNIFYGCINNGEFKSTNILFPHLKD